MSRICHFHQFLRSPVHWLYPRHFLVTSTSHHEESGDDSKMISSICLVPKRNMFWSFKVYFGVQYPMPEPEPFLVLETGLYFDVPYPSLSTEPIQSWIHDLQRVLHTDPSTSPKVTRPCLSDDGSRNSHAAAGTGGEVIMVRWKGNLQEPPILGLKIVKVIVLCWVKTCKDDGFRLRFSRTPIPTIGT